MLAITSIFAIATAAMVIDVYQWSHALPLWVDEEMIALNVRDRSLADLSGALWLGQSAPFGWLALERMAMIALGTGEAALRAVPLVLGMATVGAAAWVGRRWMGRVGAAAFVLLCWIGPYLSHYRFEVKHYTADVLFGLLLPALAAWAIEPDRLPDRTRRIWLWWMIAAFGHWIANGAVLVTPACAVFLAVAVWRRDGLRAAGWFAAGGLTWLASFGLHYLISLRHALDSAYLRSTWTAELLPPSLGPIGILSWLFERLEPLAFNPGGTAMSILFWVSAIAGLAFSTRRLLGIVLAGVPLSAFAFAAVVPLHQRFSIWIVPALYAGVALLIDRAVGIGRAASAQRRWPLVVTAALILLVQVRLVSDILTRGKTELDAKRRSTGKHQLDDRAAVAWLRSRFEPGDVLVTTPLALPAVWWYWKIPISDGTGAGRFLDDGSPVYEVRLTTDCRSRHLDDALKDRRRVLLYLGFDVDPRFDQLLLDNLSRLGRMTAHEQFAGLGRTAVIDLRLPKSDSPIRLDRPAPSGYVSEGCVGVRQAERW